MSFEGVIEIVESPARAPGLRVCPTGGGAAPFFLDDSLTAPFCDAFGYDPDRTKRLTRRLLELLLLLLLARRDPESIRKLGYTPSSTGQLALHEVARLAAWSEAYGDAAMDPKRSIALRRDLRTSFPAKLPGPLRFGGSRSTRIWIDLDAAAIRGVGGALEAALLYIAPGTMGRLDPGGSSSG